MAKKRKVNFGDDTYVRVYSDIVAELHEFFGLTGVVFQSDESPIFTLIPIAKFNLERAKIHIIGGRLVVRNGFAPGDEGRYSNALFNFLSMGHAECEIDLLRVGGVSKPFVDLTTSFAQFAEQMGRTVVVTTRESVAHDLRIGGYENVGRIRVVDG